MIVLVRFEVLGPLRVLRDGEEVALRPRQRALLCRLLMAANRAVAVDQLLDELWPDPASAGALSSLQAQVSKLRSALGNDAPIDRAPGGYRLRIDERTIDAWQLEQLAGDAHRAIADGRPADALAAGTEASALWRGVPYAELDGAVARSEAARLEELRLVADTDRLRALVDLGRAEHALAELAPLLVAHPYDERLWGLRMLALHRAGRSADALQVYQEARRVLGEDLGLEPGLGLRTLEAQILAHDPAISEPPSHRQPSALPATATATVRDLPPVRYTRNGDVHLAYRVIGEGDVDIVWVPDYLHHLDVVWEHDAYARWLDGLASFGRLITYDKRGQGLSDRTVATPPVADRVGDLVAVLDAAGSSSAVFVGCSEGSAIAGHLAAWHPERVRALVLFGSAPSGVDFGLDAERYISWLEWGARHWGTGRTLAAMAPSVAGDDAAVAWYGRLERHTIGPSGVMAYARENANETYLAILPLITAPTIVLHRRDEPVPIAGAHALADGIGGSRFVELDGTDHHPWFGDTDEVLRHIGAFLAEVLGPVAVSPDGAR